MSDYYTRHGKYAAAAWHRRFLENAYRRSYRALEETGCRPLDRPPARVLLCGVGAAATTTQFSAFLEGHQDCARLVVMDLAMRPLVSSRDALCPHPPADRTSFVRADARALPFSDGSFDLVETDFLIQLLSPAERGVVLREWARVLRPGGGLMTRDWVRRERGLDPAWDAIRRAVLRGVLGLRTYVLTVEDLRTALAEAGFTATVRPLGRWPLIHLVAAVARGPQRAAAPTVAARFLCE